MGIVYFYLQSIDISATASGRGQLIFGDHDGNLHFIDRDLQMSSFKAYILRVTHLYQLKQHNILITVGVSICWLNLILLERKIQT